MLEKLEPDTRESFEEACAVACILAERGELIRRRMGYDKGKIPERDDILLMARPFEIVSIKRAIMTAVQLGYYCHAYTSCERGSNENINRMIRRRFPKGTDFDKVSPAEVKRVEEWINNYPREILGFWTASEMFEAAFSRAA